MGFYNHYLELKKKNPDALVLYRVGDFYELFGQDAVTASKVLDLALTSRDCGLPERVPMCGVPYHCVGDYISKLIQAGCKAAVCESTTQLPANDTPPSSGCRLNLTATTPEETMLKEYLEQNASDVLADKINNGVRIVKDGKTLISKKDLAGFMEYAYKEAQEQAAKGARAACIDYKTVFGWATHYFEEDSIEGTLYNEDGTKYKPKPAPRPVSKSATPYVPPASKPKEMTLFDLIDGKTAEAIDEDKKEQAVPEEEFDDEEISAEYDDEACGQNEETEDDEISDIVTAKPEPEEETTIPKGLRQIDANTYVDEDGVVHTALPTLSVNIGLAKILNIFGNEIEVKL